MYVRAVVLILVIGRFQMLFIHRSTVMHTLAVRYIVAYIVTYSV